MDGATTDRVTTADSDRDHAKMTDRAFDALPWRGSNDPRLAHCHDAEGQEAVGVAHADELAKTRRALTMRQSVLVVGEKGLTRFVLRALEAGTGLQLNRVTESRSPSEGRREATFGRMMVQLHEHLRTANQEPDRDHVTVIPHLDLMMVTNEGHSTEAFSEIVFWLTQYAQSPVLAFWDPEFRQPKILDKLFPHHVSLEVFRREILWQLVSEYEARRLSRNTFTLAAQLTLYQYLSGVNVVDVRRILRELAKSGLPECKSPANAKTAFDLVRQSTPGGTDEVIVEEPRIAGYEHVKARLQEEVVGPVDQRLETGNEDELRKVDALIPRGVLFAGPPGTGKTEWGRWLAWRLQFTLLLVHGPELKRPLVGETEAAIRSLFATARRMAPSLILMEELDALMLARTADSHHDSSMVAQFLTEMDGLRRNEAVLVVGNTNRGWVLDDAFFRPSRFGIQIEVGYPQEADRRAILEHYNGPTQFDLGLTPQSLDALVEATGGPLDPQRERERRRHRDAHVERVYGVNYEAKAGPDFRRQVDAEFGLDSAVQFSGDHLRAICLYLMRKKMAGPGLNPNQPDLLRSAVDSVARRPAEEAARETRLPFHGNGRFS